MPMASGPDRYLVVGNPIAHSRSPEIHAAFAAQTGQNILYERRLIETDPPEAFAAAMQALIQDAGRRTQLGQAGRERAEARYSRAAYRNKLRNFYLKTVGPPPG